MNYQIEIHKELRLVSAKLIGTFNFDDILKVAKALFIHPDYQVDFSGIADEREADIVMSHSDIERLVALCHSRVGVLGRWAHLIDGPKSAATAYKYKKIAGGIHESNLFSTVDAAGAYLEIKNLEKYLIDY